VTASGLKSTVPAEVYLWCEVEQVVVEGKPSREVLANAEGQNIDLICMGERGVGSGLQALFSSTIDYVLRRMPCPVFVARALPSRKQERGR
jgi:nucleotide-binding universal stress UspA family protein